MNAVMTPAASATKNFRLGQKHQAETETGRKGVSEFLFADPIGQEGDGQNGKNQAVKKLVGIGRDVIVVADDGVFVEGEHQHDAQANRGRRPPVGRRQKPAINQNQQRSGDGEICENERAKRNPKDFEQQGVEILGQRPARQIMQVPIQHRAPVNPPGQIELQPEVDEHVRPFAPRDGRQDDERHRHHRQAGPWGVEPRETCATC